jgi:hypothetical protein
MRTKTTIAILAGAALVAGCASQIDQPQSATFGDALDSMRAQATTGTVSEEPPVGSGATGAAAIKRVETGQTKAVVTPTTSDVGTGPN